MSDWEAQTYEATIARLEAEKNELAHMLADSQRRFESVDQERSTFSKAYVHIDECLNKAKSERDRFLAQLSNAQLLFEAADKERDELTDTLAAARNEVASVLMLMDNQANIWGDEGVFRRCRDRLRALLPKRGAA